MFKDYGHVDMNDVGKFYSLKPRIEVEIEEIKELEDDGRFKEKN